MTRGFVPFGHENGQLPLGRKPSKKSPLLDKSGRRPFNSAGASKTGPWINETIYA